MPVLRFPEYSDEWKKYVLGDLFEITSASRVHKNEWTESGVPFFRSSDVVSNYKGLENKKAYISEELYKSLSKKSGAIEKNHLLVTGGGSIGIPYLVKDNAPLYFKDADLLWLKNSNYVNGYFLYIFFLTFGFRKYIRSISHIGTIAHYTIEQARSTPIKLPSNNEQQKIADFLTAVDTKIQQLKRKHSLMQQYKKGVMQQLFSQQVRFKDDDGRDYPDWEEKRLGDVAAIYDGTHSTPKYTETGVPFYSVEHVTANDFSRTKFISEEVFAKENERVRLEKNDILMTRIGDIGTSVILFWDVRASFYVSLALIKQSSYFDSRYLHQHISSTGFQKELFRRTIHVAFPKKINLGEIGNCFVSLPCLEEQRKIADFLGAIDAKIQQLNAQITQAETFKKGLLQQMFV